MLRQYFCIIKTGREGLRRWLILYSAGPHKHEDPNPKPSTYSRKKRKKKKKKTLGRVVYSGEAERRRSLDPSRQPI